MLYSTAPKRLHTALRSPPRGRRPRSTATVAARRLATRPLLPLQNELLEARKKRSSSTAAPSRRDGGPQSPASAASAPSSSLNDLRYDGDHRATLSQSQHMPRKGKRKEPTEAQNNMSRNGHARGVFKVNILNPSASQPLHYKSK